MNEVGFSREYTALQLRYNALKERVANQIEMLHTLVFTTGPNIKARYMMFVGRLEYKVYELKVEASRWKRRLALRQAALNRGETPDLAAIEATLERLFAGFLETIRRHAEEISENARLFSAERLSAKEDTDVRVAYLNAVKKLHPDLNPNLPQAARDLWNEIQAAYARRDWAAVRLLAALADSVVSGDEGFASAPDAVAALREACEKLEAKSNELKAESARLQGEAPFVYREFLADEEAVSARQDELKAEIVELKAKVAAYEKEWNNG